MSYEHELSTFERNGRRVDLSALLEMGKKYQKESSWTPPVAKGKAASKAASQPKTDEEQAE